MSSSTLSYLTLDVFTQTRYVGNPLAIVHVPAGTSLSQEQKQLIAREFNYSETVFLHLPSKESDAEAQKNFWKIDIFAPDTELPFAGHPTIGTACHVLSALSADTNSLVAGEFLTKAGKIALKYDPANAVAQAQIPHNVRIHAASYGAGKLLTLQPSIKSSSFADQNASELPVVSIVNGMTFVLVELRDLEQLSLLASLPSLPSVELDEGWSRPSAWPYGFVRLPDSADGTKNIRTRLMMLGGEDPATGSAACALSSYLTLKDGKSGETVKYAITQGVEMGRKSDIGVEVKLGADGKVESVQLSGSAVQIMEGKLSY